LGSVIAGCTNSTLLGFTFSINAVKARVTRVVNTAFYLGAAAPSNSGLTGRADVTGFSIIAVALWRGRRGSKRINTFI